MSELIKITRNENNTLVVSARELHEKLGSQERMSRWFDRMVGYGFVQGEDYTPYHLVHPQNKQEMQDFAMTIDMAKQVCMLQRTEIGQKFRRYFIECEKKLKSLSVPSYQISDPIERAKKWIEEETIRQEQAKQLEEQKPMVAFAAHVSESADSIDMGKFAKILHDENIRMGRNKLFDWMKNSKYLMRDNTPYQQYVDAGYFDVIEQTYNSPYGEKHIATKTLVTGKGQIYFTEKLRKWVAENGDALTSSKKRKRKSRK